MPQSLWGGVLNTVVHQVDEEWLVLQPHELDDCGFFEGAIGLHLLYWQVQDPHAVGHEKCLRLISKPLLLSLPQSFEQTEHALIGMPLVVGYTIWIYKAFSSKTKASKPMSP